MNPDEMFMVQMISRAEIARNFRDYGVTKKHISPRDPALTSEFCRELAIEIGSVNEDDTEANKKLFTKYAQRARFELA